MERFASDAFYTVMLLVTMAIIWWCYGHMRGTRGRADGWDLAGLFFFTIASATAFWGALIFRNEPGGTTPVVIAFLLLQTIECYYLLIICINHLQRGDAGAEFP